MIEMWSESAEDAAHPVKLSFNTLMLDAAMKLIILSIWTIFSEAVLNLLK